MLIRLVVTNLEAGRQSTAAVVFAVSRTLLLGRLLWGEDGAVTLAGLSPVVGAPPHNVERAVDYLCREGLAELDDERERIGLTARGLIELGAVEG